MTEQTQIYLLITLIGIAVILLQKATKAYYKENRYNQKLRRL